jgi:hypothetical protein
MGLFRVWEQPPKHMPVIITACVSKKVGQANYGSAGYSLTVQSEVSNLDQVQEESHKLYQLLNESVNQELGTEPAPKNAEWPRLQRNNGSTQQQEWRCSDKQRDLILKLIDEHHLEKDVVQNLAKDLFETSEVSSLNKLQASGLIDHLIEQYGGTSNRRGTTPAGRFNGKSSR